MGAQIHQFLSVVEHALNVVIALGSLLVGWQLSRFRRDLRRDRRWSRRSFRRHGERLDEAERRLDQHDSALDVDTRVSQ